MELTWMNAEPLPLLFLTIMLLLGIVIVLLDLWRVRKDALCGAASSRFAPFWGQLGFFLLAIGCSTFLFLSPLFPHSWQSTAGFVITLCSLYVLFACLRFIWMVVWLNQGYVRRDGRG